MARPGARARLAELRGGPDARSALVPALGASRRAGRRIRPDPRLEQPSGRARRHPGRPPPCRHPRSALHAEGRRDPRRGGHRLPARRGRSAPARGSAEAPVGPRPALPAQHGGPCPESGLCGGIGPRRLPPALPRARRRDRRPAEPAASHGPEGRRRRVRAPSRQARTGGWASPRRPFSADLPPLIEAHRRLAEDDRTPEDLAALWNGTLRDPFAEAVVVGTADLALVAAGLPANAAVLWTSRPALETAP